MRNARDSYPPVTEENDPHIVRGAFNSPQGPAHVARGLRMGETLAVTVYVRTHHFSYNAFFGFLYGDTEEGGEEIEIVQRQRTRKATKTIRNTQKKKKSKRTAGPQRAARNLLEMEETGEGATATRQNHSSVSTTKSPSSANDEGLPSSTNPGLELSSSWSDGAGGEDEEEEEEEESSSNDLEAGIRQESTLLPLSHDSDVELEIRFASAMRQRKNQIVRTIPPALSPRMGVNNKVRVPIQQWMIQAAASMADPARLGNADDTTRKESALAFRFSVDVGGKKRETTWFPLVSNICSLQKGEYHSSAKGEEDVATPRGTNRVSVDGGQGAFPTMRSVEAREAERELAETGTRYLSTLTFSFGFRSGVVNTITSLRTRAYYSEAMPSDLVIRYQWDEHRPHNPHFGIALISVFSAVGGAFLLYKIVGGPSVSELPFIVLGAVLGEAWRKGKNRRAAGDGRMGGGNSRVSRQFRKKLVAMHHHED